MAAQNESGRIPSSYQEVEYVNANAVSGNGGYFSTGIVPKINPTVNMSVLNPDTSSKSRTIIYLASSPPTLVTSPVRFNLINEPSVSGNVSVGYGTSASNRVTATPLKATPSDWVDISVSNKFIVDGTTVQTKTAVSFANNVSQIVLGSSSVQLCSYRYKDITIYDGESKVAELVPCYRKSDNAIGFYCLVRNEFYPSSNSCSKGADV